jgi:uncharacterized membrane protein YphA (DoxX/SURF4 family)
LTSFALSFRFVLAAIFLCAGGAKLSKLSEFETALRRYRIAPERSVRAVSLLVPLSEVVVGVALGVGLFTTGAALLLTGMLVAFASVVATNLARGREFDCGCGVSLVQRMISWPLVAQNLALAAAGIVVAMKAPRALAADQLLFGASRYRSADVVAALAVSVLLLLMSALVRDATTIWRVSR